MTLPIRTATSAERDALWPAIEADRLLETPEELRAEWQADPWLVRIAARGEGALLGRWRDHLRILAMRGVWCHERHVPDFAADALELARQHGFAQLMSPLLPEVLLGGYRTAGMRVAHRIVAVQGRPELILPSDAPLGVRIREAEAGDLPAVARIDAVSFDGLWRYEEPELTRIAGVERLAVAQAEGGAIIGYTLATVIRGSATLSRLATAPHAQGCGIGRALLSDVARWATRTGAVTLALCTQEENAASRSLYAAAGLSEVPERFALAMRDT
jgi:ribosomal protein S18 acetylase RimI-like enzyme